MALRCLADLVPLCFFAHGGGAEPVQVSHGQARGREAGALHGALNKQLDQWRARSNNDSSLLPLPLDTNMDRDHRRRRPESTSVVFSVLRTCSR